MAIRFVDKPEDARRQPAAPSESQAAGAARFATPIEAEDPVNPDAEGELPFSALPRAEKAERKKRPVKAAKRP